MATSRIEQIIEDIYDFVDGCRTQALSSNKVIVPKDTLYDLLDELRLRTPDEIKRYQKIISNRDAIISDAEDKASKTIAEAEAVAKHILDENEIVKQAYSQAADKINAASNEAEQIIQDAKNEASELLRVAKDTADEMVSSAKLESDTMISESYAYANDLLAMIENALSNTITESKAKFDSFHSSMTNSLSVIKDNRDQINKQSVRPVSQTTKDEEVEEEVEAEYEEEYEEDYDYSEV